MAQNQIGSHMTGAAHVIATDGGVIEASGEVLEESVDRHPDDCQCPASFDDLPCWPCYHDGFRDPNPAVKEHLPVVLWIHNSDI